MLSLLQVLPSSLLALQEGVHVSCLQVDNHFSKTWWHADLIIAHHCGTCITVGWKWAFDTLTPNVEGALLNMENQSKTSHSGRLWERWPQSAMQAMSRVVVFRNLPNLKERKKWKKKKAVQKSKAGLELPFSPCLVQVNHSKLCGVCIWYPPS